VIMDSLSELVDSTCSNLKEDFKVACVWSRTESSAVKYADEHKGELCGAHSVQMFCADYHSILRSMTIGLSA
jgi:hypothetical protein